MANKNALELMMPERLFEQEYKLHRRRVDEVEPQIDDRTPHHYLHLDTRLKQAELRERRQTEIERENKVLVKRMTDILMGREDKFHLQPYHQDHHRRSKSINIEQRQRVQERVAKENISMAKRIERVQPIYRRSAWEADWEYRQKVLKMLETKKYKVYNPYCSPPRQQQPPQHHYHHHHHKKLSSGYGSDSGSNNESGDETNGKTKKKDKLPPIQNGSTQNGRGRPQQKGAVKQQNQNTDHSPRLQRSEDSYEFRSPDPDLWMYYGIRPGDSSDENDFYYKGSKDDEEKNKRKKNVKDEKGKKSPEKQTEADAKLLFKVARQGERPHDIIIKTLALKSFKQRTRTKEKYEELYGTDLENDLKCGLGPDWNLLVENLFREDKSDHPKTIGKMMKSGNAPALVRKLTPLSNNELAALKEDYLKENSESLESDISAKFDSPTDRLLLTLIKGTKREKEHVSDTAAERDAKALLEHGDGRWTSESGKFLLLLEQRSPRYMSRVFDHYKMVNKGRPAVKSVQEECPREYADALTAYINCSDSASSETIDRLHKNIDATNPDFVRTIVVRSETDMPKVRKDYKKKYGNDIAVDLEQRSSHTTVSVLKAIINKPPPKAKGTKASQQSTSKPKRSPSPVSSDREEQREEEERQRKERLRRLREQEELYLHKREEEEGSPRHHKDEDGDRNKQKANQEKDGDKETKTDKKEEKSGPSEDATRLYNAMKGLGTDEDAIIDIIPERSNAERQNIKKRYQELYKQDLVQDIKSETSGDFQEVVLALLMPPVEFEAFSLYSAMKGLGTDESALIGIICSRTPAQLEEIKKLYKKEYKRDLEGDVRKDTSGDFRDLLLQRLAKKDGKPEKVDADKAETDATTLHVNPAPDTLREVFKGLGSQQIKATADAHQKLFGEDISESIKRASSGDAKAAYLALVAAQNEDQTVFYADRLHSSMAGLGTNDTQLIRILVSRSEVDLPAILATYQSRHGKSVKDVVESDTSGDYGKTLLRIVEKAGREGGKANGKKTAAAAGKAEPKREKKQAAEKKEKPKDAMASPRRDGKEKGGKKEDKPASERAAKEKKEHHEKDKKHDKKEKEDGKARQEKRSDANEEEDAVKLFNAMKGVGTDEATIIEVITRNSNAERQALKQRYQSLYQEDLVQDMKSETSGDLQEVLLALLMPPVEFEAFSLYSAMKGLGTDESALIGIICSRTPAQLEEIKKIYKKEYNKDLETEVKKETRGDLRDLLVHLLSGKTDKGGEVDKQKAEKDAAALHDLPTTYEVKALFNQSPAQIAATDKAHQELFGEDITRSIRKATSGDLEKAYLATLKAQENMTDFFVYQLEGAMEGLGTNDTILIWTIVSRSEIDLPAIKSRYQELFGRSLVKDVEKETSGDYGKTLLKVLEKAGEGKPQEKSNKKQARKQPASKPAAAAQSNKDKTKEETGKDGRGEAAKSKVEDDKKDKNPHPTAKKDEKRDKDEKKAAGETVGETDEDVTKLYKAMKGLGTDEAALVEVLVRSSNSERQALKDRYQELYKQDLVQDIKSESSGDLQEVVLALLMPPVEFEAFSLYSAMKGLGTDESALIGIICSRTPAQLEEIKKIYKKEYENDLESEVEKETSGRLRELLLKLLSAKPSKAEKPDKKKADTDARLLHETPSDDILAGIFIKSSPVQILSTASAHKYYYGEDISESIKKASCGDEEKVYIAYASALQNLATFYTERLHAAMEGIGSKETQLTRILVSTSETDLPVIKGKYARLYGHPLRDDVKKETSGDYQKALLALLDKVGEVKDEEKPVRTKSATSRGPEEDAIRIYKAMHRVGTEEDVIVDIVCKLSNAQRQELKKRYYELYKQDLEKDLRSELSGNFEDTVMALMVPADDYDAVCLNEAMKGVGTDETTLIGIVCSKNNTQLEKLRETYKKTYKRDLEMEIVKETSGNLREMLLALALGKRDGSARVDDNMAGEDAKSIHDGPTADTLRRILVSNSTAQVQATVKAHQELYKEDITESIKKATVGDLEEAYIAVVRAIQDEVTFFTERVHSAMKGLGTNETQLTRIIIARSELDLPAIKVKYSKMYGPSLKKDIISDTSGDYRRTLLRLLDYWSGPELPEDKHLAPAAASAGAGKTGGSRQNSAKNRNVRF